ncbi:MAG: tRNA (guanine(10)-N(2))-dimethyltransferase [Thermoplasmata archaeon]|nr:MAG: tRNA (guanine(10)-N(2))-dimethyltransferase [Thermoplasmata archaeon]
MKLTQVREGTTDLLVPAKSVSHTKGPSTKKMDVFFNPVMEFSRDVSVLVLREFVLGRKPTLLDGLAGTGARGVRLASEVEGDFSVVLNDRNPAAVDVINRNVTLNGVDNCRAEKRKLNALLGEEDFDYVDVDPFGSPVNFIDAAVQSLRKNGMLAVTATDSAPLCGTYKKTSLRRYGAISLKTSYSHEIGARILAGHCIRTAAQYDIALTPVLSFFSDHYLRIHLHVEKGARKADSALRDIGYVYHNRKTGERKVVHDVSGEMWERAGPLWIGNLHEKDFLKKIKVDKNLGTKKKLEKYLELWVAEAKAPPLFYELNEIASLTKTSPLPMNTMIEKLKANGFVATKTHFSPNGFKTDAALEDIKSIANG